VIPVKRSRHSGGCRARSEAFSAIHVVNPTIWIPTFAGMTPEGLLKGFAQFRNEFKVHEQNFPPGLEGPGRKKL
jgi:hypothetical protein